MRKPLQPFTLREIRERMGLTVDQVAKEIGVSESTFRKWESGKNHPTVDNYIRLCKFFRVGYDWLAFPV